ncbi:acyltransferase family protein [Cellulomonas denverensis]|uniref:Acyltransferase n=1 Tax=Cellulomonas denverensis TaxID=264297 RepID=A0A7X6KUU8_9CELL|nr:acyltransferase [Cellulomonas denverensis]NKY22235.1 acyltransferase [Cellulomonas denverensis]GIG27203.1 acyltransferase [Cellulomonas denverensis]
MTATTAIPVAPNRIGALDGLRGVAAAGVAFFYHYQHFRPDVLPFARRAYWLHHYGNSLVELFFVISGFVFCHVYLRRVSSGSISFGRFAALRWSRLYPLHLVTLVVVAALQPLYRALNGGYFVYPTNDVYHFLLNLGFVQNGLLETRFSFNGPSWSVAVEIVAYVLFFAVAVRVTSPGVRTGMFALLVVLGLRLSANETVLVGPVFNWQIGQVLVGFFMGCLVYTLHEWARAAGCRGLLAGVAVIGLVVLAAIGTLRGHEAFGREHSVYTLAIWPLLVIAVLNLRPMSAMLSWRPFAYLGSLSYAIYMCHFPVQLAFVTLDSALGWNLNYSSRLVFAAYVVGTFAVAALAHKFLEMPAQRWLRSVTAAGAASEPRRTRRH